MRKIFILTLLMCTLTTVARADEARLLRFPAVGGQTIVFSYAGDLYAVPVSGGEARKLTYGDSYDVFPKLSPDGRTIAFTGQFDGNTEVYTLPIEGGVPHRVTYTATLDRDNIGDRMGPNNIVMGWTPDGSKIIYRSRWKAFCAMRGVLCEVDAKGGPSTQLPMTEGGFCSYSPDGKQFAFNRMFREFRTWKHYRGGQADDIWLNKVGTTQCEPVIKSEGQDLFPMWVGQNIYFISDRDFTMNLFRYSPSTGKTEKLTDFKEYDVKFPAASQQYIVFENGGYIYKYTVATGSCEKVSITLNDNNLASRPVGGRNVAGNSPSYDISPDASRVLLTARGEIFSVPAEKGAVYNLSRTPGAHETEASWSADGKYIAYFSDKTGEYQLYLLPTDKMGEADAAQCVTSFKDGFPYSLQWSPDSKRLYFFTEKRDLYSYEVASKSLKREIVSTLSGLRGLDISPDGRWLTYSTSAPNEMNVVYLYEVATGKSTAVTSRWFSSGLSKFTDDGKYLIYVSDRNFKFSYSQVEWNTSYSLNSYLYIVPLARDTELPNVFKASEFKPLAETDGEKKDAPDKKEKTGKEKESKAVKSPQVTTKVDVDGIVERAALLLNDAGSYNPVGSFDGKFYFSQNGSLKSLDLKSMEVKDAGNGNFIAYAKGAKKMLVMMGGTLKIADPGNLAGGKNVSTDGVTMTIEPREEWKQIFEETWRTYRDNFYVSNMHGVDWSKIHDRYAALLPYVNHRHDLTYIISEMIGEMCVGHTYITSGEAPAPARVKVGLLGAVLTPKEGFYKVEKIYKGFEGDPSVKSPLRAPGVDVKEGDYIVAVDGTPLDKVSDIYEALNGKVGVTVALDVNSRASTAGARRVYVTPIGDETQLAYYDWVLHNMEKVDKLSGGKIGYIHIPDMGPEGLDMFTKLFYSQLDKKALLIDDRMNGGGNVSPMILERLQRHVYRMTMSRNGRNNTVPNEAHYGPKLCLIDKYSMSDGDLFPYGFREVGLGKLVGTRTWGGIVGISGSRNFLDGQDLRTPFFTSYSVNGDWIVENKGVTPDEVVDINPFDDYLDKDAQLIRGVELLTQEMKNYPDLPGTPADPVRVVDPNK